jgi:hypothetical protein
MRKVSTPGDRASLKARIPVVMTELEIKMPVTWCTTVMHLFVFHTLAVLKSCGPFSVSNMLDIERFHTVFKKLARGTKSTMASIKAHYKLLLGSLANRLDSSMDWTTKAAISTVPGQVHSARMCTHALVVWSHTYLLYVIVHQNRMFSTLLTTTNRTFAYACNVSIRPFIGMMTCI